MTDLREMNPFENEEVSLQWISSVERERGEFRDRHIYPRLRSWRSSVLGRSIVEVGSGQGACTPHLCRVPTEYTGVEPSETLVARARECHSGDGRRYVLGNAYELPLDDEVADGVVLVNVLFHLKDVGGAAKEINRVLKSQGRVLIITANPASYDGWEQYFFDYERREKMLIGKFRLPNQELSQQTMYLHTQEDIEHELTENGLEILSCVPFGKSDGVKGFKHFVAIEAKRHDL